MMNQKKLTPEEQALRELRSRWWILWFVCAHLIFQLTRTLSDAISWENMACWGATAIYILFVIAGFFVTAKDGRRNWWANPKLILVIAGTVLFVFLAMWIDRIDMILNGPIFIGYSTIVAFLLAAPRRRVLSQAGLHGFR